MEARRCTWRQGKEVGQGRKEARMEAQTEARRQGVGRRVNGLQPRAEVNVCAGRDFS